MRKKVELKMKRSSEVAGLDYSVFIPVGWLANYVRRPPLLGKSIGEVYVECRASSCGEDFTMHVDMNSKVATVLKGRVGLLLENSRENRFGFMTSEIWCRLGSGQAVRVKSRSLGSGKIASWKSVEELSLKAIASGYEPRRYPV